MVKTDFENPQLTVVDEIQKAEPETTTTIKVKIQEEFNLEALTLNYTKDNDETFSVLVMQPDQNQIFNATIPGEPTGTLIDYSIQAMDVSGNVGKFVGSYWVKNSENLTLETTNPVIEYGNPITVTGSTQAGKANVTLNYQLETDLIAATTANTTTDSTDQNQTITNTIISRTVSTDARQFF